jgi:hypothetical protein
MGLRQMFPVQTKRTLFTIAERARGPAGEPKIKRSQVNALELQNAEQVALAEFFEHDQIVARPR